MSCILICKLWLHEGLLWSGSSELPWGNSETPGAQGWSWAHSSNAMLVAICSDREQLGSQSCLVVRGLRGRSLLTEKWQLEVIYFSLVITLPLTPAQANKLQKTWFPDSLSSTSGNLCHGCGRPCAHMLYWWRPCTWCGHHRIHCGNGATGGTSSRFNPELMLVDLTQG